MVEISISMNRDFFKKEVTAKAEINAEKRVIDALVGVSASNQTKEKFKKIFGVVNWTIKKLRLNCQLNLEECH